MCRKNNCVSNASAQKGEQGHSLKIVLTNTQRSSRSKNYDHNYINNDDNVDRAVEAQALQSLLFLLFISNAVTDGEQSAESLINAKQTTEGLNKQSL